MICLIFYEYEMSDIFAGGKCRGNNDCTVQNVQ